MQQGGGHQGSAFRPYLAQGPLPITPTASATHLLLPESGGFKKGWDTGSAPVARSGKGNQGHTGTWGHSQAPSKHLLSIYYVLGTLKCGLIDCFQHPWV